MIYLKVALASLITFAVIDTLKELGNPRGPVTLKEATSSLIVGILIIVGLVG